MELRNEPVYQPRSQVLSSTRLSLSLSLTPGRVGENPWNEVACLSGLTSQNTRNGSEVNRVEMQVDNCAALCGPNMSTEELTGSHKLERATSMYSCHGVFTDQFIFRTVLARSENIF